MEKNQIQPLHEQSLFRGIEAGSRFVQALYEVAHQTALKARATIAKKGARERQVTETPEPAHQT